MHLLNVVVFLCCVWILVSDWSDVENSTSFVKVLVDLQQCSLCTYTGPGLLDWWLVCSAEEECHCWVLIHDLVFVAGLQQRQPVLEMLADRTGKSGRIDSLLRKRHCFEIYTDH